MTKHSSFTKPSHITDRAWALAGAMTLRQLAGQLTSIDPGRYQQLAGEDITLAIARGEIGGTGLVGDRLRGLQEIAVGNGHPPLLVKDDGRRGFYLIAPFPLYCFDMALVRRAHEQAADDAYGAGASLIRITCDYAFAQHQGRTQEGGLISCPRLMSEVTRASTEGLMASGRTAVILKHMGPYQYTVGPDYTALPIERTEFLETVLPRYAGGFEAGADGVMMSFVALNGVPAHADPYLRDLVVARAGPGAIIESDYDGIYEIFGGFGYAASPKEAAFRAFVEGGVHIDLCSLLYLGHLPELVEEGRIPRQDLLVRAAEMLTLKERVGLLDDPWRGTDPDREQKLLSGPTAAYRDLAQASVVLLRPTHPDPSVLPIPAEARVCVLGPLAHQQPEDWLGAYCSHGNHHLERVTTPLAGIRQHWPDASYARGCDHDLDRSDRRALSEGLREIAAAATLARDASHVVLFLGESHKWSGESATLAEPKLPEIQRRLVRQVRRANPDATLVVFITAGRALAIPAEIEAAADALFWTAHVGSFAGDAIADILAGVCNPTARLSHGLPIADGITSGFDTRQARIDRPAVPVVPGSASRRQRHHWCAYYLGLGARWPAAYHFGEGYSYTSFALSDRSLDTATLSVSGGTPVTASVRVTNTGDRAGTETVHLYYQDMVCEERVPRLMERLGHRQATLAPGETATLSFEVTPADARQVRPRPRGRPPGLARPRPCGKPRPAVSRPARRRGARRHRALRRRAVRARPDRRAVAEATMADRANPAPTTWVFPLAGQSNMVSRADADGSAPWPAGVRFVAQDGSLIAPAAEIAAPAGDAGPFLIAKRFAADFLASRPQDSIVFVPGAVGGTSFWNHRWNPGDDLYDNLVALTRTVLAANPGWRLRAMLFQGFETDGSNAMPAATFRRALVRFVRSIRADLGPLPIVFGELPPGFVDGHPERIAIRDEVLGAPAYLPLTAVASSRAPSVADDDGLHYSTAGLLDIGSRFAPALAAAEANTLAPADAGAA